MRCLFNSLILFLLLISTEIAQARAPIIAAEPVNQQQLEASNRLSNSVASIADLQQQVKQLQGLLDQQQQQIKTQEQQIIRLRKQFTTLNKKFETLRHHSVSINKSVTLAKDQNKAVALSTMPANKPKVMSNDSKIISTTHTEKLTVSSDNKNADQAYNTAFTFVKNRQYDKAIEHLKLFC